MLKLAADNVIKKKISDTMHAESEMIIVNCIHENNNDEKIR